MADRPRGNQDPSEFNWLYGSQGEGREPPPSDDPEPTRLMPAMQRPESSSGRSATPPRRDQPPPDQPPRSGRGSGGTRPPRRRSRGWTIVKLVIVAWLVFLVAVPVWAWSKIDKVDAFPDGDRPGDQPGRTYLLVGSDSRENLTKDEKRKLGTGDAAGKRTDTIMLLHTGSGPNLLLSIPRDSIVPIPGHGTTKINAAYAYGGPKLLIQTLEQNTGVRIDDFIELGFGGFVNTIDAVGGVEICPTKAMKDRRANLKIEKGCQDVDGITALGYARSRHTSALGDIDRARHQREVVSAIGAKVKSPWTVINPLRYYRVADGAASSLTISEGTGPIALMRFAWAMTRVDGKNGLTCSMPIRDLAVHWDKQRALALLKLVKEDHTDEISTSMCGPSGLPDQ